MIEVPRGVQPSVELQRQHTLASCDDVLYVANFIDDAATLFAALTTELDWREESILMFGKHITVPRLCAWCGDAGILYRYSHTPHRAQGWPDVMRILRERLHDRLGIRFNFALANQYRSGNDAMSWHADDEVELGEQPCIASLSFGAPRQFHLRARDGTSRRTAILLESGSLLLMWGRSQDSWQHAVPRTKQRVGPRINLTFRQVHS